METIQHLYSQGGATLVAIVLMSIGALAIGMERLTAVRLFRKRLTYAVERIVQALQDKDLPKARAINQAAPEHPGVETLEALLGPDPVTVGQIRRMQQRVVRRVRAGGWILGTIAATAPFVGLFGTVRGIMEAFAQIGEQGTGGFDVVSAGIAEALITTAGGILVGVEAMFLFNFLQAQGVELVAEFKEAIEEVREAMEAQGGDARADRAS